MQYFIAFESVLKVQGSQKASEGRVSQSGFQFLRWLLEDGPRRGGAAHARRGVRVAAPRSLRTEEALALHKETTLKYRLGFS